MPVTKITLQMIENMSGELLMCRIGKFAFAEMFPEGMKITKKNVEKCWKRASIGDYGIGKAIIGLCDKDLLEKLRQHLRTKGHYDTTGYFTTLAEYFSYKPLDTLYKALTEVAAQTTRFNDEEVPTPY